MNFKLYQMDVKNVLLNGYIEEEVYASQPSFFEDHKNPNHVYNLKKALYGLKQVPKQWYERLNNFFLEQKFERVIVNKTLFIKNFSHNILLVQVYVDDIIVGSTYKSLNEDFVHKMQGEFKKSMMGELNYFLGLQVKQLDHGTFIHQTKYYKDLKKFEMDKNKETTTLMATNCYLSTDE